MEVHKVEILVVDFDGLGQEELKSVIENTKYPNRCIYPKVKQIETVEVEWDDCHPLNMRDQAEEEYKRLFGA